MLNCIFFVSEQFDQIIKTKQTFTYHTEFLSKAANHLSINFCNGIEKVQSKAVRVKQGCELANDWDAYSSIELALERFSIECRK